MVAFTFNAVGHSFERGLMILRNSLTASLAGLEQQEAEVTREWDAYNAMIEAGGQPIGQYEEGFGWIHEKSDEFKFDLDLISDAKSTVRKIHTIAIYHLWERIARTWTNNHGPGGHDDVAKGLEACGLKLDPRLKKVSFLNNALKHNSQKDGPKLLEQWPGVLPDGFDRWLEDRKAVEAKRLKDTGEGDGHFRPDWFQAINLTDVHMDDVFGGVRESGPWANTPRIKA